MALKFKTKESKRLKKKSKTKISIDLSFYNGQSALYFSATLLKMLILNVLNGGTAIIP